MKLRRLQPKIFRATCVLMCPLLPSDAFKCRGKVWRPSVLMFASNFVEPNGHSRVHSSTLRNLPHRGSPLGLCQVAGSIPWTLAILTSRRLKDSKKDSKLIHFVTSFRVHPFPKKRPPAPHQTRNHNWLGQILLLNQWQCDMMRHVLLTFNSM